MQILLLKTLRDLREALARTAALVIILAIGIASYVALIGAYRDLSTSYNNTYTRLNFADVTFDVRSAPEGAVEEIQAVNGVAAVTGRLIVDTGFEIPPGANSNVGERIRARLIGLPATHHPAVDDVLVEQGRYFSGREKEVALIETHFASAYGLGPGSTVTPLIDRGRTRREKVELPVVGVAASPEYLIVSPSRQDILPSGRTFAVLFMPLDGVQQITSRANEINNFAVLLEPGVDQNAVIETLKTRMDSYGLITTTLQKDQPSHAALQLDLNGYHEIAYLMPGMILFVAAASTSVMLSRQVRAQQPQIGLMKALGYRDGAIVLHYLALALLIGVLGAAFGVAIGLPLVRAITEEYAIELGIPLVETRFYPDLVVQGATLGIVTALLAGIGPAWRATGVAPAAAMRLDPSATIATGRPSLLERIVRLPPALLVPVRNTLRLNRRSITTGLGLIFAYVLILTSWGMIDSMREMINHHFDFVQEWDLAVGFADDQDRVTLSKIEHMPGVQAVDPVIMLPGTIDPDGKDSDILVTGLDPGHSLHRLALTAGESPQSALGDGYVVLSSALAGALGKRVGDTVVLKVPDPHADPIRNRNRDDDDKDERHTLVVGGITQEMQGAVVYISLKQARDWVNSPYSSTFNTVFLTVDPAEVSALKSSLYDLRDVVSVQEKSAVRMEWQALMGFFYAFIGVLLIFSLAMAFALLFNAMTINVLERRRELATMRAFGTYRQDILFQLNVENVMLWLVTVVPGLVLGTLVARGFGSAFQSELFDFRILISPLSYVLTAGGILLTMILATLPPARRINHQNIAEATRMLT